MPEQQKEVGVGTHSCINGYLWVRGGCSAHSLHTHSGEACSNTWSSTELRWTERDEMQASVMLSHPLLSAGPGEIPPSTRMGQTLSLTRRTERHFYWSILLSLISHWRSEKLGHSGEKDFPCLPGKHLPTSHCHQLHSGSFNGDSM